MRRSLFFMGGIIAVAAVAAQGVPGTSKPARKDSPAEKAAPKKAKPKPAADHAADEAAIRANITKFVKAYNAGDAKGVAALFTPDALILNKDGDEAQGRKAIEQTFAEAFKESPKMNLKVNVESIRFLGPNLALETGTTEETVPGEPPERESYTVLHARRNGKWQMAMAKEEEGEPPSNYQRLQPLAWMLGEWIDDGGSVVVASTCRWSKDKNFLLQDFRMKVNGKEAMDVHQRIGWDPHAKRIHSWVFDSEGGFGESDWTQDGNAWIIRSSGVRPDGTTASATNFLTPTGKDGYVWRSTDRIVAEERQPNQEVRVVRKPPQPKP
jgi:uncharacterized protein (TIGR02246 family)